MHGSKATDAATVLARAEGLLKQGNGGQALEFLQAARAQFPRHAGIAARYADALHLAGRLDDAVEAYRAALDLDDTTAETWYALGCAQLARSSFGAALQALSRALTLAPDTGPAQCNLGRAFYELGQVDPAVDLFRRAARSGDQAVVKLALANLALIIPGSPSARHEDVLHARQQWVALLEPQAAAALFRRPAPLEGRKLRVGYVSAFFGARNWMKPVWGLINHHDRSGFEIHLFSDGGDPSAESGYHDWPDDYVHVIRGLPNERAARIIAQVGIDVLVDLNGYSHPERLPLFLLRPAPVLVGWFNMFATTGMTAFDWLVGDDAVIRPEEEQHYVERIHRLPGSYLAFEVLYPVPEVAAPPVLTTGTFTFGCLGSQYKITDEVLAAWGRILQAATSARLFIKNRTLDDSSNRADLLTRLARHGVTPERVRLEGRSEHFDYLRAYDQVDVALDTFPYNGGTTTTEAIWQGVPVLAFDGDRWAASTSRSLLLAAGLADWVMPDENAYVQRGIELATDPATPALLAVLRAGLRDRLRGSPACDTAGLARAMEAFYLQAAAKACQPLLEK